MSNISESRIAQANKKQAEQNHMYWLVKNFKIREYSNTEIAEMLDLPESSVQHILTTGGK